MRTAYITVDLDLDVQNRGEYWAVATPKLGITVYGDTEAVAMQRLEKALSFFAGAYGATDAERVRNLRAYLDAHGVSSTYQEREISVPSETSPQQYSVRREARIAIGAA